MGGGDLNLKKSWHPSTMRNIEKVWKAEQKNNQEKKRIAELQKEIREERAREDMQKYAQEKGVIEKKDDVKLDWMYKGPSNHVDREEYLLGRKIDKTFEQIQQSEHPNAFRADSGGIPSSILRGSDQQVDLAKKLQEDPLYDIKKKEIESKTQLLKNPVKLQQLKQMLEKEKSKSKKHKKKSKKHKKSKSSDDDSDEDLDKLLLSKYSKYKNKLSVKDILKNNSSSESEKEEYKKSHKKHKKDIKESKSEDIKKSSSGNNSSKAHLERRNKYSNRPDKRKLTEKEIEKRRREMMDNAKWREKEREKNVKRYREEDSKEKEATKNYDEDFLRKEISKATSHGTVESRIKSNMNNIQRSNRYMDQNFARR